MEPNSGKNSSGLSQPLIWIGAATAITVLTTSLWLGIQPETKIAPKTSPSVSVLAPKAETPTVAEHYIIGNVPKGHDGEFTTAPVRLAGQLIDPLPTQHARVAGEKVSAWATVRGTTTPELAPNQVGELPRVYIEPGQDAVVRMQWPEAKPGDRIVAAVEDGGTLENGQHVQALTVDEKNEVTFPFTSSSESGIFRISVRHKSDLKVVQFWASNDPQLSINR